jgi:two-component system sensor histidine kinase KdpD
LLETILAEAGRLDRLVGNLLDLSRLQAGAAQPARELWSIDDIVVQALDEIGTSGSRVEVSFPEESPAVRVDVHQIERVLVNLLENALGYSHTSESVRVQVTQSGSKVFVRVIDRRAGSAPTSWSGS